MGQVWHVGPHAWRVPEGWACARKGPCLLQRHQRVIAAALGTSSLKQQSALHGAQHGMCMARQCAEAQNSDASNPPGCLLSLVAWGRCWRAGASQRVVHLPSWACGIQTGFTLGPSLGCG